jgi:hypothetical protein
MSQFFFLDPMVAIGEPSYIHSHSFDLLCFRYWVDLTSVGNTPPGSSTSTAYTPVGYSLAVILDSGTSYSYIPQSLFNEILATFPEAVDNGGTYTVPCSYATQSGTMDFGFGDAIINVPYSQFIVQPIPGACVLGVQPQPASQTIPILGDTFLRGAYGKFREPCQRELITN